jgi:hypothetical protein
MVLALASIYHRQGGKRHYSAKVREFERPHDNQTGRNLTVVAPISSGERRSKARAIAEFARELTLEVCQPNHVWIQGLVVGTWRPRPADERIEREAIRRERARARHEAPGPAATRARRRRKATRRRR